MARSDDDQEVAIKCLAPDGITTERRKRFKNELEFCAKCEHPGIVKVLDSGFIEDNATKCPFYVMPLYERTLDDAMQEGLASDAALRLFSKLLDGVEAAHLQGISHRDLKPKNVLCQGETPIVADFGIARFAADQQATDVETKPGTRLANFQYAAPEQRVKGAEVGLPADVLALGLMLTEMLTGEILQGTAPRSIAQAHPDLAYLDEIAECMRRQDPNSRPTIDGVKKALIGHRNAFVARQKFDEAKRQVVPEATPDKSLIGEPIQVTGAVDYEQGKLTVELNREPSRQWIDCLRTMRGGYRINTMGMQPDNCQFSGSRAWFPAQESSAQAHLRMFEEYVNLANDSYAKQVEQAAQRREREAREHLEQKQQEASVRARVLDDLKQ